MRTRFEALATVTLLAAAVAMAVVVVKREFFGPPPMVPPTVQSEPVYHEEWRALLADGILIGDAGAR